MPMSQRLRFLFTVAMSVLGWLVAAPALAAPEAKILRIDPRAAQSDGAPIITTVIELAQRKRVSDATSECAYMRGEAMLECMGQKLAQPRALFQPFPLPQPAKDHMIFTVQVDGADQPANFVDAYKWDQAQGIKGVGTAWLIVLDAAGSMGAQFDDAQAVAIAFINSMGPQDIANVTVIGEGKIVTDSKWQPASQKAVLTAAVTNARMLPKEGRARQLMTSIRQAATDAFKDLGNAGTNVEVPLHQAMVVISNGQAGGDVGTNGLGATQLAQYLTKGRFPEDNPVAPKMPLPVISILTPVSGLTEEFTKNATDFMTNLANPEIGGYFGVVRSNGGGVGPQIVAAVRDRFNQMYLTRWRVSCVAPTVNQTFNLVFKDVNPAIAPDGYRDVPVGIDPTVWPLDVNREYTVQIAKQNAVAPGGKFKVFGNFCWGASKDRAQAYFIPANMAPPAAVAAGNIAEAKKVQQQLIAAGMQAKVVQVSDGSAEFEAPDSERILVGKGEQAVVRIVLFDSQARRTSGVTASTILQMKAGEKSLPIPYIVAGAFGIVILLLLVLVLAKGGGGKKGPPPRPVPAGPPGYAPPPQQGGPPPGAYAAPAPIAPPPAPAAGPAAHGGTAVLGAHGAPGTPAAPPAQANPEFLYGGKPPQYGLTSAQPQGGGAPPPNPYGGSSGRATLSGAAGVFTVNAGAETRVGRDAAQCGIVFNEGRVSSVHATVKVEGGQLLIRDESSNNGTHVNGTRLAPGVWMPVPPGSMVRFGPVELSVRID